MNDIPYDPDRSLAERIRQGLAAHVEKENERQPTRADCPYCNPTAKAIRYVQDTWVVAGIE